MPRTPPLPHRPPGHACPLPCTSPLYHPQAHIPPVMHAPWACTPHHTCPHHACPPATYAPLATHVPQACMPLPCHACPRGYYEMRTLSERYVSYWNTFLFDKTFPKICMKMKEIELRGASPLFHLDLLMFSETSGIFGRCDTPGFKVQVFWFTSGVTLSPLCPLKSINDCIHILTK